MAAVAVYGHEDLEKRGHSFDDAKKYSDEQPHPVTDDELNMIQHYDDIDEGYDKAFVRRVTRKIDWRMIPILSLMYCISLIDRTNLSITRQANNMKMHVQLDLGGNHYSIATIVFFIPYILLEIPSQLGLRAFGARWWLGSSVIAWGLVMIGMGYSTNWHMLAGLRAMLGLFESTLFPGAAYLIGCWYPRSQMATRNGFFYATSTVVSGLSSILGWGISQMDGMRGLGGWQWIFIIEGAITVAVGLLGYLLIHDFPDKAKFLTEDERDMVKTRIQRDRGDAVPDGMTWAKFVSYLLDVKIWIFGFMFGAATLGSYSLAYFMPAILQTMGFTNALAQILVAPPYVWVVIPAIATAWFADKTKQRAAAVAFNSLVLIVGTVVYSQLPASQKAGRYVGLFLAAGGCNSNVPLVVAWAQSNIRAQSKRGYASALIVAWGGIGGILAGVVFMDKERTTGYPTGVYFTIAINVVVIALCAILKVGAEFQNRKADRGEAILEGSPDFRYQA